MSDHKVPYGWRGHILVDEEYVVWPEDRAKHNVVGVPSAVFSRLINDYWESRIDERIEAKQLGVQDKKDNSVILATGVGFSRGLQYYYGTVFVAADSWDYANRPPIEGYVKAMQDIYGIKLPYCHMMIGCSVETE